MEWGDRLENEINSINLHHSCTCWSLDRALSIAILNLKSLDEDGISQLECMYRLSTNYGELCEISIKFMAVYQESK